MLRLALFCCLGLLAVRYAHWDAVTRERQANTIAACPNFDSVRVHRVDWATRSNVYVRTIPSQCWDSTAVTPGYYR